MSCPCDKLVRPSKLRIAAGLKTIPRQIATFPEFRAAMLAALRQETALADWRARGEDDLGVMLLEMWAYVCDALSFYDEVIAHEAYLRTARLRPSVRRLVDLLGYVPRPAVAAAVKLAALAEGRQAVTLPIGTAFRSGAFGSNPPQVFELDAATKIHPFFNQFTLEQPRSSTMDAQVKSLLLEPGSANLEEGDVILVQHRKKATWNRARGVSSAAVIEGKDGETYLKVTIDTALDFPASTAPTQVKLSKPTQTASLWTSPTVSASGSLKIGKNTLTVILDGVYRQIKPDDFVILTTGKQYGWFQVTGTSEKMAQVTAAGSVKTVGPSGKTVKVNTPAASTPATQLTLKGTSANWKSTDAPKIVVHHTLITCGTITVEGKTTLTATDSIKANDTIEKPETGYTAPTLFQLEDKNETGVEISGTLDLTTAKLKLGQSTTWKSTLVAPVELYSNVVTASCGETVSSEILGSGDASEVNQAFTLKKKPLAYKSSPTADNERGVASTLKVYVDSILWTEVSSFYGVKPDAQVYVVRQNDEGESVVTFGDGVRGARLPSGTDNVVATYRYGGGATIPPAGSITQIAKPVKGLKSVKNPVAAYGGADADSVTDLRKYAPRSALIMGRAVSIQDMEAVAAGVSGVRAAHVEWRWDSSKQRPVVQVWYIGKTGIETTISQTLRNLTDPSTPISVKVAQAVPVKLSLSLEIDSRYLVSKVTTAVQTKLTAKKTGLLSPEQIGVGCPLYRSHIFETVLSIPGVKSVQSISWDGKPFSAFAVKPKTGRYFDFESTTPTISGKAAS